MGRGFLGLEKGADLLACSQLGVGLDPLFPSILILSSNESEGIKGRQPVAVLYGEARPLGAAAGARQGQGGIGVAKETVAEGPHRERGPGWEPLYTHRGGSLTTRTASQGLSYRSLGGRGSSLRWSKGC